MVPWGLRNLLNYIKDNYGNPPVMITENGISDRNSTLQDEHRVNYYREYINNVLKGEYIKNALKGEYMYINRVFKGEYVNIACSSKPGYIIINRQATITVTLIHL